MMKPRSSRVPSDLANRGNKIEPTQNGASSAAQVRSQAQAASQAAANAPAAIRKRRSSINVYDQPSSLNSRLRQLETDMLRLDEDRTKLFDDTHSTLAQYELKLGEIHAILKSRQDNVDKYVEDMKMLLVAKEEFEKQTRLLNEKHDRIHEKFTHRETIISREIKLLKTKFEMLEKNRQFRSILQKSAHENETSASAAGDELASGLADESGFAQRTRSEATISEMSLTSASGATRAARLANGRVPKSVRIKLSKLNLFSRLMAPLELVAQRVCCLNFCCGRRRRTDPSQRRRSNRVSSLAAFEATTLENESSGAELVGPPPQAAESHLAAAAGRQEPTATTST